LNNKHVNKPLKVGMPLDKLLEIITKTSPDKLSNLEKENVVSNKLKPVRGTLKMNVFCCPFTSSKPLNFGYSFKSGK